MTVRLVVNYSGVKINTVREYATFLLLDLLLTYLGCFVLNSNYPSSIALFDVLFNIRFLFSPLLEHIVSSYINTQAPCIHMHEILTILWSLLRLVWMGKNHTP